MIDTVSVFDKVHELHMPEKRIFDLSEQLIQTILSYDQALEEKNIEMEIGFDDRVMGTIAIRIDKKPGGVCVIVQDTGCGILARISKVLAANEKGIFAIFTYNTEYVLTKEENFRKALDALLGAGYEIEE